MPTLVVMFSASAVMTDGVCPGRWWRHPLDGSSGRPAWLGDRTGRAVAFRRTVRRSPRAGSSSSSSRQRTRARFLNLQPRYWTFMTSWAAAGGGGLAVFGTWLRRGFPHSVAMRSVGFTLTGTVPHPVNVYARRAGGHAARPFPALSRSARVRL